MKCRIDHIEIPVKETAVFSPPYLEVTANKYCTYIRKSDAEKTLMVEVAYDYDITSAVVRPLSLGIVPRVEQRKVSFELKAPCNISIEVNDAVDDSLMLFAGGEKEYSTDGYENVIAFEAGVHIIDELKIHRDSTMVYLAEDAEVHGRIFVDGVKHFKLCGPGTLTMKRYPRDIPEEMTRCVVIQNSADIVVSDLCLLDSSCWTLRLQGCDDVSIENVKIIGCRGNSDGIDVCGSRNVHVTGCFIRTYDDCLVVKAFDTGDSHNILFEKCVLWNDMARPIEVGVEIRCDRMNHVVFRDMDVIHSLTCYPIFGIHHGDRAEISDVHFENIRIEHAPGAQLFDFRITDSVWNEDTRKGRIRDVYIRDIFLVGREGKDFRTLGCRIEGFSSEHDIQNVCISNINAFGKKQIGAEAIGLEIQGHVQNVVFQDAPDSGSLPSEIQVVTPFALRDGHLVGEVKLVVKNCTGHEVSLTAGIHAYPQGKGEVIGAPVAWELAPGDSREMQYQVKCVPGKLVLESYGNVIEFKPSFQYFELPYRLARDIREAMPLEITNAHGETGGQVRFALDGQWLEIHADCLKEHDILLYAAVPVEKTENQILFSAEESYYGVAPNVKWKNGDYVLAPEIGNHFEITYVFLNQPPVEQIVKYRIPRNLDGVIKVPLCVLGIPENATQFWLELEAEDHKKHAKPLTLFRSTYPECTAHMFCTFER